MKKTIFLIIFSAVLCSILVASDIPFFKSLFMGDEEYVRQEILKCKDIESVEIQLGFHDYDTRNYNIYVYLTKNRYIHFSDVQLGHFINNDSAQGVSICICQINDLCPVEHCYDVGLYDLDSILYHIELKRLETKLLKRIASQLKVENILDIINNIDEVYSFISDLPELPFGESFFTKFKTFDYKYNEILKNQIPEELKDDIPFSIIEKHTYKLGTYESGYKFYKMSVDRAVKENSYGNLKYNHENHE